MNFYDLLKDTHILDLDGLEIYATASHYHHADKVSIVQPTKVRIIFKDSIDISTMDNLISNGIFRLKSYIYITEEQELEMSHALKDEELTKESRALLLKHKALIDRLTSYLFDIYPIRKDKGLKVEPINYYFKHYRKSTISENENHLDFFKRHVDAENFFKTSSKKALAEVKKFKEEEIEKLEKMYIDIQSRLNIPS